MAANRGAHKSAHDAEAGTRRAIYATLVANALIAVAKFVAAFVSGSAAMLAEAAHSVADTTNQAFLLVGLRLSKSAPDEEHPYGRGKDRFFWSFYRNAIPLGRKLATATSVFTLGVTAGALEPVAVLDGPAGHALGVAFTSSVLQGRSSRRARWGPRGASAWTPRRGRTS